MSLNKAICIAVLSLASTCLHAATVDVPGTLKSCNQAIVDGDAAKALGFADEILKPQPKQRDALLCKSRAYLLNGQNKEAMDAVQAAEKISQTPLEHTIAITLIGNVYKAGEQYKEALVSYQQALVIAHEDKNKRFERIDLNLIGDTQAAMQQLDAALESYFAGGKLAANDNERGDSYARIASVYSTQGKHDQAIEYQIKAMLMEQSSGDLDHFANASVELGRIYIAAKDYPNAEKSLNKIIKFSQEQGGEYWEAMGDFYLAQVKTATNDSAAAKSLLNDAKKISERIGATDLTNDIDQALQKLN